MSESAIHLRVPAATKARWVRESRAAGMRLTDWIVGRVDSAGMRAVHPGEVLHEDFQRAAGLTAEEFAARLQLPAQKVLELLQGRTPVTAAVAERIVAAFGGDVQSWLELQAAHDRKAGHATAA